MKKIIDVKVIDKRILDDFGIPSYQTDGSAGIDLKACINEAIDLPPGETELIPSNSHDRNPRNRMRTNVYVNKQIFDLL